MIFKVFEGRIPFQDYYKYNFGGLKTFTAENTILNEFK